VKERESGKERANVESLRKRVVEGKKLYESNEENLFRQSNKNQAKHSLGIFSPQLELDSNSLPLPLLCYERMKWCELSRRRVENGKYTDIFTLSQFSSFFNPFSTLIPLADINPL
jgi:hypothetical protein